jgi:hypothetical protein
MLVRHFAQCGSQTAIPSSPRNQREFNGSRPSIFPEGGYCTVRKRQPVSLTLPDHLFNFAGQELIDLSGIIDLAAAIEKLPSDLLGLDEQLRIGIVAEPCRHRLSSIFGGGTPWLRSGSEISPLRKDLQNGMEGNALVGRSLT